MFRRDVQNLSDVLNRCLRQNGLETPLLQYRLVNAWDEVVGKGISNPALRADLSMMKTQLVRRLNNYVGSMVIADIKIY